MSPDRLHLVIATSDTVWPAATIVAMDEHAGRRYRCPCGWEGWTAFGRAWTHRRACAVALTRDQWELAVDNAYLRAGLERVAALGGRAGVLAREALEGIRT